MSAKLETNDPADFLFEMAKLQGGVACATVSDGHVLLFSKAALERLLKEAAASEKEHVVLFVKRSSADPS